MYYLHTNELLSDTDIYYLMSKLDGVIRQPKAGPVGARRMRRDNLHIRESILVSSLFESILVSCSSEIQKTEIMNTHQKYFDFYVFVSSNDTFEDLKIENQDQ